MECKADSCDGTLDKLTEKVMFTNPTVHHTQIFSLCNKCGAMYHTVIVVCFSAGKITHKETEIV